MAEKSVLHPKVTWNECIEFAKTVSSFNLKAVSYAEVGKKYGLNNTATKSFTSKLTTCKQFGLITTSGGNTIQITDTCKRLLYPTGEDTLTIARACFAMAPLYNKLIAAYDGKAIPNIDLLANILMNNYGIQKSVKDSVAKVFIESCEQLNLIKGGILYYSDVDRDAEASKVEVPVPTEVIPTPPDVLPGATVALTKLADAMKPLAPITASDESDYITQSIPFESGKIAKFSIPIDATEDDLLLLHDMFEVILKRKFKFNAK